MLGLWGCLPNVGEQCELGGLLESVGETLLRGKEGEGWESRRSELGHTMESTPALKTCGSHISV